MQPEGLVSIELAMAAAVAILGFRLGSMLRVTAAIQGIHERLVLAITDRASSQLRARVRRLGYQNPYAELALELLHVRDGYPGDQAELDRARTEAITQIELWGQRGHALDLTALGVLVGLSVFASRTLPTGPVLWVEATLLGLLITATLLVRARLVRVTRARLEVLHETLTLRPSQLDP